MWKPKTLLRLRTIGSLSSRQWKDGSDGAVGPEFSCWLSSAACQRKKLSQVQSFLRKLRIELLCDPAIPLLVIYLNKTIIQKDTCTSTFIAALFIIANTWKQPKCPSTDEWIKKTWYIYEMEYYSAIKIMK